MNTSDNVLQKIINDTEKIFADIAENYPRLLGELDNGINEAQNAIQSFTMFEELGSESGAVELSSYLDRSRVKALEDLKKLDSFEESNRIVLERLSSAMEDFENSSKNIEEIRDISESLQIVSLNALCNAVKAGKGGEGFSVITGNLKNVTENTIENTGLLEKKGDDINVALEHFYEIEKDIDIRRKSLLSTLEDKVVNGINTFKAESETINKLFSELSAESKEIRSCILSIMQELQQQDLIRQTIDQIILSIQELPEGYESCDSAAALEEHDTEEAVFCIRLINLALFMINDIEGKLLHTIDVFDNNFRISRSKLEYIQNEKVKAVKSFMTNLQSFNELSKIGSHVISDSNELSAKRKSLIDLIKTIIERVESISTEFSAFEKISGWLQNVAVLSRIELSRSSRLSGMRESVDDMSTLVERIQEQISAGEKETLSFISQLDGIFEEYKEYAAEETGFLFKFTEHFMDDITKISQINNTFSEVFTDFDFFTDDFKRLFEISEKDLDQLKEIAQDLSWVKTELEYISGRVEPLLSEKMHGEAVSDWDITDSNMKRIIEQFTIYSHKKTAGDVSGLDVENSVLDEGEITLF